MGMKRVFFLLLVTKVTSQSANGPTSKDFLANCTKELNSSQAFQFQVDVSDKETPFSHSDTDDCRSSTPYMAVIENEIDACVANKLVDDRLPGDKPPYTSLPTWIRFAAGLNASNPRANGTFLGNRVNFTMEKSREVCIALKTSQSDDNKTIGTWITMNCSEEARSLCVNVSQNATNVTTNSDIFPDEWFPQPEFATTTTVIGETGATLTTIPELFTTSHISHQWSTDQSENRASTTDYNTLLAPNASSAISECVFAAGLENEDTLDLEKRWKNFALDSDRDCVVINKTERFHGVLQKSTTCNDDNLKFSIFSATCPNSTSDEKYAAAEIVVKPEMIRKYIHNKIIDYDQNRRITRLAMRSNKLFSFSILRNGSTASPSHGRVKVTFRVKLSARDTLLGNAFQLLSNHSNNNAGLLATTRHFLRYRPECVFLNKLGNKSASKFDTYGCHCTEKDDDYAKCVSNHTTIFAVLLAVDTVDVPQSVKILSVVTQSISVFFLALAFFILMRVRKKVRGDRIAVQINLVVSMFFLHFSTLFSDIALHYPAFCRAVAVLTHFFLLSSALWMTNEAILLFLKTSKWAFVRAKRRKVVIATMIFAWGTAAALTAITVTIGFSDSNVAYMNETYLHSLQGDAENVTGVFQYQYCWLNGYSGIRWAAIVPVMILIVMNLAVAVKVAVFVYCKRKEMRNFKPTEQVKNKHKLDVDYLNFLSASLKAFILLTPTLGIPWLFMLASNINESTVRLVFMYTNVILNGLQGVFIFILYCVVGKEVRSATVKSLSSLNNTWHSISDTLEKRRKKSAVPTDPRSSPSNSVHPVTHPDTHTTKDHTRQGTL